MPFTKTHGLSKHRLYRIRSGMKNRCYNEKASEYIDYGGRGITICDEWLDDFMSFYNWAMSNGYSDELTIDRIDNNGNYEPDNCRWITMCEQQSNKRNNRLLTINNETHNVSEWERICGVNCTTMFRRINVGWNEADVISSVERKLADKQSPFVGVTWNVSRNRWKCTSGAIINGKYKEVFIGWYYTENRAVYAKIKYELDKVKIHNKDITEEMLNNLDIMLKEYINSNKNCFKDIS